MCMNIEEVAKAIQVERMEQGVQSGKISHMTAFLPLTVREAVEVWLPTVKVTVPESA